MLALADMGKVVDATHTSAFRAVIERGAAEGALPDDTDPAEVKAQLTGSILAIALTPGAKLSPEVADGSDELFLRSRIPWSEG